MPSGPDRFVEHPAYTTEFSRARALVLGHPGRWRIIYHYDGDGIASASSMVRALHRLGYEVQATPLVGVERARISDLLNATKGPVLIVDTGAAWPDLAAAHPAPVVVLDHHTYPGAPQPPDLPDHVAFVNPLDWGVDGMSELCAASLTWLFTIFLDPKNWDNASWGLSGAIADRQHVGGFKGVNRMLLDGALERSLVVRQRGAPLAGTTLGTALRQSIDPYFAGLSGRPSAIDEFLHQLGLAPERSVPSLEPAESERLSAALLHVLVTRGVRPEFCEVLHQDRWWLPSLGLDAEELSNLQNATGRAGTPSLGVALALGDPQALDRARSAETQWRAGILSGLRRLEEGGVNSLASVQWFESPETTLAGTQAGLAMNYLIDPKRPVFVFSASEDGTAIKVSGRGTMWLVGQGLDLAVTCRDAARSVGGEGGGHKVASGATLPNGTRDAFLAEVDRIVGGQIAPRTAPTGGEATA
ncbi:MAG: DHHA1 domain-containing protein [Thermoplasmata archaeon]